MGNKNLPNGFRAVMCGSGNPPPVFSVMTKANLSLMPGDAIIMLSDGTVDIATAASTAIFGVCQSKVTAVAGTKQKINYVPALDDCIFEGQCSGTFIPTNCGESVDIEGASGAMMINEDAQSVGVARIIGVAGEVDNAVGQYARVFFTWNKSGWNGQA